MVAFQRLEMTIQLVLQCIYDCLRAMKNRISKVTLTLWLMAWCHRLIPNRDSLAISHKMWGPVKCALKTEELDKECYSRPRQIFACSIMSVNALGVQFPPSWNDIPKRLCYLTCLKGVLTKLTYIWLPVIFIYRSKYERTCFICIKLQIVLC